MALREPENRSFALSRRTLLFGASALGVSYGCPQLHAAEKVGLVTSLVGSASLARADGKIAAMDGAPVLLGDLVETGEASRLALQIGEATRIKLGAKASLRIDRFVPGVAAKLQLDQGAVLVEHGPGAEKDLDVETPYALIAARGTKFWGGPSNGVFGVFVVDGEVEVRAAGRSVRVGSGMGTDLSLAGAADKVGRGMGGTPPTTPHPWAQARIQAALQTIQ